MTIYYVDSKNGNDSNSGTAPGSALSSVDKVNALHLLPGDQVLAQAGQAYRDRAPSTLE